jgi:glycosyltransferase involved in cell wall biosynthesis
MIANRQTRYSKMQKALLNKDFTVIERLAIDTLKESPLDEKALMYLGEALLQQGYGGTAKKILKRALLFHPQKDEKWGEFEKRLQNVSAEKKHEEIEEILEIQRKPTVAAAILTQNEERWIRRCINSILDVVDEIVVIDTGSTDETINMVRSYPKVKLVHFHWCNDFSKARNFGLFQVQSNWVLWLDADEYLHPDDRELVKEAAALLDAYRPTPLLHPVIMNRMGDTISISYNVPRMFPLRGDLRYHGRIHEQIVPVQGDKYKNLKTSDFFVRIRILHDGYDPKEVDLQKKLERNIHLLLQMVKEEPDDPTWLMFLGREVMGAGDIEKGLSFLIQAEEKAQTIEGFGALLEIQRLLIKGYLSIHDYNKAEQVCDRMRNVDPAFPDLYYYLAYIQTEKAKKLLQAAEENLQRAKDQFAEYRGLVSPNNEILEWKADLLMANIYGSTGRIYEAKRKYQELLNMCPSYKEAIQQQLSLIEQEAKRIL